MSIEDRERIDALITAVDVAPDGPEQAGPRQRLADLGVHRMDAAPGVRFDPTVHKAVATAPASAPSQENTVVETVRPGWVLGDTILRYVEVRVHVAPSRHVPRPEFS